MSATPLLQDTITTAPHDSERPREQATEGWAEKIRIAIEARELGQRLRSQRDASNECTPALYQPR